MHLRKTKVCLCTSVFLAAWKLVSECWQRPEALKAALKLIWYCVRLRAAVRRCGGEMRLTVDLSLLTVLHSLHLPPPTGPVCWNKLKILSKFRIHLSQMTLSRECHKHAILNKTHEWGKVTMCWLLMDLSNKQGTDNTRLIKFTFSKSSHPETVTKIIFVCRFRQRITWIMFFFLSHGGKKCLYQFYIGTLSRY